MVISLAQTKIKWEEKQDNIKTAEQIITNQARNGSDMVLFPEMSFTGFSMNTGITGERNKGTIKILQDIGKNNHIAIGFGWVQTGKYKSKNKYTILDKNGNILSSYEKIHPFSYSNEDKYFSGGKKIEIFSINDISFCTFVCYDLRFPELFRIVADSVHVIIIPANWPAKRSDHWKTLLKARAIENQVYIFAVNCVGIINGIDYSGDSCVINPNGEVVNMLSNKEGVIVHEFEDDVGIYREDFPVLKDKINIDEIDVKVK